VKPNTQVLKCEDGELKNGNGEDVRLYMLAMPCFDTYWISTKGCWLGELLPQDSHLDRISCLRRMLSLSDSPLAGLLEEPFETPVPMGLASVFLRYLDGTLPISEYPRIFAHNRLVANPLSTMDGYHSIADFLDNAEMDTGSKRALFWPSGDVRGCPRSFAGLRSLLGPFFEDRSFFFDAATNR